MTIQDLTCFLKLAENLNYTKTAEELFISQPAVTRHINSLEDELGVKLFDRSVQLYTEMQELVNKALENPLIINLLRGIHIPDEYVAFTNEFMASHPTFHHFTNFIDSADIPEVLEKGEIVICQAEYLDKHGSYKSMQLTKNPVPHYLTASKTHSGFANPDEPDFTKIRNTALFLPKNMPGSLKEKYLSNVRNVLEGDPNEIMYLDSMDSVDHFLRSGRCFTICSGWQSMLDSKSIVSYEMDFSSHYVAMWDETKCVYPLALDYLKSLKKLEL